MHSFCPFATMNDVLGTLDTVSFPVLCFLLLAICPEGEFTWQTQVSLFQELSCCFPQWLYSLHFSFSTFSQILAIFHCFNNRHFIRGWHKTRKRGEIRLRQRGIRRLNHWKEAFKSHENEDLCSEQPRNRHRNHHRVMGSYAAFCALWTKYLVLRLRTKDLKPQCCGMLSNVQDSDSTVKAKLAEAILCLSLL